MDWRRFLLTLFLVLAVSITILSVIYIRADTQGRVQLEFEIGKAMLNAISAVLISGIVLVIVRDFEERRKKWIVQRDLLRTDLTEGVSKQYSGAKRVRRLLRVSVTNNKIAKGKYDELLNEINDIQLSLEQYKGAAEMGAKLGALPELVARELGSMEKYLGKLVKEYEQPLLDVAESSGISLESLPQLNDFISYSRPSRFRSDFVAPYHRAANSVAQETVKDLPRVRKAG